MADAADSRESGARRPGAGLAAGALGFAIGGFFDGILLHQVLQWHHLLSGLDGARFQDLRVQVLADGLFHLLMYVVAAIGLVLLWRTRRDLVLPHAGRRVIADGLIGFGLWHVADALLSHWITGIHRIRMDSEVPLAWDLGWLIAFGILPLIAGWRMRSGRPGAPPASRGPIAAVLLALAALIAGPVAALPPRGVTQAVVVFRPGLGPAEIVPALASVGGRIVWSDASNGLWVADFDDPARARLLYGRGALLVSGSLVPAGCLAWLRA